MSIKLIAIDMDGTLLNRQNLLTGRTREAIEMAKKKKIEVVIATGRVLKSAIHYSKELGLESYIAACNGAVVVDKDLNKVIDRPISRRDIERVMKTGQRMGIYFHFYNEDTFFTKTYVKEIVDYYTPTTERLKGQSIDIKLYGSSDEIINNKQLKIYKFLFIDKDQDKLIKLRKNLESLESVELSKSWRDNLEVMDKGVSKGSAVKLLCERLGINSDEVMAIGDNENDLSMIKFAGVGVAMGNAEDMVKEQADFITSSNDEDGVALAIEKYVL
ncbi:MAG TPA: Cof-type HAD-IIB family hydrolase [Gudongella oleilytica]|nr:Cof-type HAD-IIB family hydrolase [Gudongella oleilytica]